MSSLQDKLKKILAQPHTDSMGGTVMTFITDKTAQQITEAFIADGWTHVDIRRYRDEQGREYKQYTFPNEFVRVPQFSFMTGEEWYKRFEPLLEEIDLNSDTRYREIKDAAKRASGVKQ